MLVKFALFLIALIALIYFTSSLVIGYLSQVLCLIALSAVSWELSGVITRQVVFKLFGRVKPESKAVLVTGGCINEHS